MIKYVFFVLYWLELAEFNSSKGTFGLVAFLNQTRQYLMEIAKKRGIEIEGAEQIHPAKLAHMIFIQLIPELKI